jgi:hypothetical protein
LVEAEEVTEGCRGRAPLVELGQDGASGVRRQTAATQHSRHRFSPAGRVSIEPWKRLPKATRRQRIVGDDVVAADAQDSQQDNADDAGTILAKSAPDDDSARGFS